MGTALVVTVMSSRATSLVGDGVGPVAASLGGLRWAFAVSAALCVVVLGLVFLLPARIADPRGRVDLSSSPELDPDLDRELDRECAVELDEELEHDLEQECAKAQHARPGLSRDWPG